MARAGTQSFDFVMIKPSHYDDDGYPILWYRTLIPSNTLAAIYGIAQTCRERQILGPDVEINLHTYDETNRRVRPDRIIADIKRRGGKAFIAMVGVQSNQFPRAVDMAQPFLKAGLPVAIGGFHVSGCISMLPELPKEIRAAMDQGISIVAGECEEGRLDTILKDAYSGTLKPLYNYLKDLPGLNGQPTPLLPRDEIARNLFMWSSFDLGRGCPFQCSFCTIINVQGRKSRFRTADDLERIVRDNAAQGVNSFFITDDNFARNKDWESFFDRLIALRESEGLKVRLIIQVDTLCHRIPNFIDKATRAGVRRVFIGLENINPDNLLAAKKRQNKITEYRYMLQQWHEKGVYSWAGYIIGFPNDTRESLLRDVEIIKRELPLDILEFFFLTPLPGSEDHKVLLGKGQWMDEDLNKYNLHHRVTHHPKMSDAEWEAAYRDAWHAYFTPEHVETVARRHAARKGGKRKKVKTVIQYMTDFKMMFEIEGLHPLEGGIFRRKYRLDRRPGMAIENPLVFWTKFAAESAWKAWGYGMNRLRGRRILNRVMRDPGHKTYTDTAIKPIGLDDFETLDLFKETSGGTAAVEKKKREDERRIAARAVA
ncbi:MAG: radical SAM protein [Parvibaculaceae bacterium]